MITIGVDLEQFVADPYGSGIQRVLQYLAREWPADLATGVFVIPRGEGFLVLTPTQTAELIGLAFAPQRSEDLCSDIEAHLDESHAETRLISHADLVALMDAWLLPEVSYKPSVLRRFESMGALMPTAMIGYDALPMTEPANYRFPPGVAANASEYFRLLASTNALVCISEYSKRTIVERLRRGRGLLTSVAHPGGDHVEPAASRRAHRDGPVHFLRLGTMESRKSPLEILHAFRAVREGGINVRLTYVGAPSSSYEWMNAELRQAEKRNVGFTWISGASDSDVLALMHECDVLLSFGTEGYGIPVLEAIRQGMPVLFGGIQPAAELMIGQGAIDCGDPSQGNIERSLARFANAREVSVAADGVNPNGIPVWSEFSRSVIEAVVAVS